MTVKLDILKAFLNTDIVIDWHEHEELVPAFMEALEEHEPNLTWHDGVKPSGKSLSCEIDDGHFLNVDQENGHLFNDNDGYLNLYLENTPRITIIDAFNNAELPNYTCILNLL